MLDDGGRDAVPGEDLGQFDPGGAASEDEQAGRQCPRARRLGVRPGPDRVEAGDARDARAGPGGHDHVPGAIGCADHPRHRPRPARGPTIRRTAEHGRAGSLQRGPASAVIRSVCIQRAVDHVVAAHRCADQG